MTAPLSSIVSVSVSAAAANPTRQSFNKPLIQSAITYNAGSASVWTERTRSYASAAEIAVDFPATTPEYKAASKMFSQDPSLQLVKVGRMNGAKPTQKWTLIPTAVNSHIYAGNVDGAAWTYTSDSSATVAEITAGMKTAIDALGKAVTTTDNGTSGLVITATVAGVWHSVGTTIDGSARNDPNMSLVQDHVDPGLAAELDLLMAADADWYALITTFNSKACVDAVAAWAETNKRLYVVQTQDSACINTTLSGTDDVMESTQGNSYECTSVIYSEDTADFAAAAWVGNRLVDLPGSNTWMFAQLASVTKGNYSSTQRANIRAKNGNFYEDIAGVAIAQDGKVAKGTFIDFTIYKHYLVARISERIYTGLVNARKTPYDDVGITIIGGAITAQLQGDADRGAIQKGTWFVTLPTSASIPAGGTDRLARVLNGVKFYCEYLDAIHQVNAIAGTLVP